MAALSCNLFYEEAEVDAIKLEGGVRVKTRIKAIAESGVLVFGHIGLTPQSSGPLGGFKAQGVTPDSARYVIEDALAVEEAGAYALLVEGIPPELTEFITKRLSIPVYSIGAGWPCDGQLIICGDMLGQFQAFTPKFVKKYANVAEVITNAFKAYAEDVRTGKFPDDNYVYHIRKGCEEEYAAMLKEYEKK